MTAAAAEADPYVLPLPAPGSPAVLQKWISPGNRHPVSRYQDLTWSLAPLIDNPSGHLCSIRWQDCPAPLRDPLRLAAWAMINGELRPTYLHTRGPHARGRSSAAGMADTCREWMRLARWLHGHGRSPTRKDSSARPSPNSAKPLPRSVRRSANCAVRSHSSPSPPPSLPTTGPRRRRHALPWPTSCRFGPTRTDLPPPGERAIRQSGN